MSFAATLARWRTAAALARRALRAEPDDVAVARALLDQSAALAYFARYRSCLADVPAPAVDPRPRRVWQLWHQGMEEAPPIVRTCLESVRRHLPERDVVLLHERNLSDYVEVPGHVFDRLKRGEMSRVNFADVLRALLLAGQGGTWLDATVYLSAPPPPICFTEPLFCFAATPPALLGAGRVLASSWFLHAVPGEVLMTAVRDLLVEFWRHETHCVHPYYFHLMFALAVRESQACAQAWRSVPFLSNVPPHVLQLELFERHDPARLAQIFAMTDVHKLTYYGGSEFQPDKAGTQYAHLVAGAGGRP